MAKGKKGFVLYADQIETFTALPDDMAGKLIKHIFKYVNDEDPKTEDLVINIAFAPIKTQLKRDLKKYEERCKRNKDNGLKGGRPKTDNNPEKPSGLLDNRNEPKKPDIDSDKDSDIDNDKDIKKTKTPTWRNNFNIYKSIVEKAYNDILGDSVEMEKQSKFYPNVDIKLSLEKSIHNFWGAQAGWVHKKKSRAKEIDMRSTLINNIDKNKVYPPRVEKKTGIIYD